MRATWGSRWGYKQVSNTTPTEELWRANAWRSSRACLGLRRPTVPTSTGDCCNLRGYRLCGRFQIYRSLGRKRTVRQFQHTSESWVSTSKRERNPCCWTASIKSLTDRGEILLLLLPRPHLENWPQIGQESICICHYNLQLLVDESFHNSV